jgi:hypothetical protein
MVPVQFNAVLHKWQSEVEYLNSQYVLDAYWAIHATIIARNDLLYFLNRAYSLFLKYDF